MEKIKRVNNFAIIVGDYNASFARGVNDESPKCLRAVMTHASRDETFIPNGCVKIYLAGVMENRVVILGPIKNKVGAQVITLEGQKYELGERFFQPRGFDFMDDFQTRCSTR